MNDHDRDELTENVVRYRMAALLCFGIAVLLYAVVASLHLKQPLKDQLAFFGVAWWLVGCGLVPLTCYWVWRRAQVDRAE
jgi:hypothetical protein